MWGEEMKKATAILYILIFSLSIWVEAPSFERGISFAVLGIVGLLLLLLPSVQWLSGKKKIQALLVAVSPLMVFALEQQSRYSINEYIHMLYFVVLIGVYQYNSQNLYRLIVLLSGFLLTWKYYYIWQVSPELFKLPQLIVAVSLYGLVATILWLGIQLNSEKHRVLDLNGTLEERQRILQKTNDQLEQLMDEMESLTVYRERQKMAREIHDTVGHELTALTMKLELCKHFASHDPVQSEKMLQESIDDSRIALRLTRQVVETLTTPRRSSEDLQQLVNRHEMPDGLNIHLEGEQVMEQMSIDQSHVVYRLVQEAVTNCFKHSNAKDLWIKINSDNQEVVIQIHDNGNDQIAMANLHEGFGIKGMRERAEELNGKFVYSIGDGFHLQMTLPMVQEADQ